MLSEPKVEYRDELPYVAIRKTVAMREIAKDLPPLIPEILSWVDNKQLTQTGPVFFRYLSRDENGIMIAEVGVPVSKPAKGDEDVLSSSFPAGKYLTATHTGPYLELPKSHSSMDGFAKTNGLKEGTIKDEKGALVGTRAEFYVTHPDEIPDPREWVTDLSFLVEG